MRLAVIPARGGSKRIPRKNIKLFSGLPIIVWSIKAALKSRCFDRIIVSTDDTEIAKIATESGAEAPFMRPPDLSGDHIGTIPVIAHAADWQSKNGREPTDVCCIYATAPFLRATDIQNGLDTLLSTGADYAFSVTTYAFPIQRAIHTNREMRVEMFNPDHFHTRSQDLEDAWHDAGQFYWGKSRAWASGVSIFTDKSVAVPLPRHRVQDIDTAEDWARAELMFEALKQEGKIHDVQN